MFYLNEVFLRLKFFSVSFIIVVLIAYSYKNSLLLIFSFSLLKAGSTNLTILNNLIYTHPIELIKIQMFSALLLSTFLILPYFCWLVLDFFRSSLTKSYYSICVALLQQSVIALFLLNFCAFVYFLPVLWNFFQNFNLSSEVTPLTFFFELRVQEYFNFVLDFIYLVNIFICILIFLVSLTFFFGLSTVLYWKKLFYLLNLVAATILSPPDVSSQLISFIFLTFSFESFFFYKLYNLKIALLIKKIQI